MAFFLLDAFANRSNREVGGSVCDQAGSREATFNFEGSAHGAELGNKPFIMERYGVIESREYGTADH